MSTNHKCYLFLCKSNSLLNGHGEFSQHSLVVRIFRKSMRLKHVCAMGRRSTSPSTTSIVNRRGPSDPWRPLKPLTGMRDVPVTNWTSLARCSLSKPSSTHYKYDKIVSYLPEESNDRIFGFTITIVGVFLPISNVKFCNTTNQ